jgi:serine-type D-Ala-D-Ala carboxypeptidase (penicillin-binding protein 5/6)
MLSRILLLLILVLPSHLHAYQFKTKAKQGVILDLASDSFIFEHNADERMAPASMSKLMTLYVAFDHLKAGILNMEDRFQVSRKAWERKGSSMYLKEGQYVTVKELLQGIIIASGNDASITLAEGIAGSEENFVAEMNDTAQELDLNNSHFTNASGWPDQDHFMSARDIATLSKRIFIDFPEYYGFFSIHSLTYNDITQQNKNSLLFHDIGVDGLKTGYLDVNNYGIAVSAEQNGRRIFAVVNGLNSIRERIQEAKKLVLYSFNHFNTEKIFTKGSIIEEVNVLNGKNRKVGLTVKDDVIVTYNSRLCNKIKIEYKDMIPAPITKGQEIGKLYIQRPGIIGRIIPLYAISEVRKLNSFERLLRILF